MKRRNVILAGISIVIACSAYASASPTLYGPTPYLSVADSPFASLGLGYFYLEDFEDFTLNTPGVTVSGGYSTKPTWPASVTDSVDGDDGAIDGSGTRGNSWFFSPGSTGLTFTFNAGTLGTLPTHAGIVWTDGSGTTRFEAFDGGGNSLGVIGPVAIADGVYTGTTAEDRFFGIYYAGGIGSIHISNTVAGMEVDHLQYGGPIAIIPAPGAILLGSIGAAFVGWLRRRKTL